ncbi:hypothetical protein [Amycolatopsis aidingensis]|uniref:hypothetical protein n=1 Tax=Amycolatopsis aidingensis TaxID=2842453 RepID=UPI001C0CEB36|nr:hypothetical protein [Amycolatopsis aidingensis]
MGDGRTIAITTGLAAFAFVVLVGNGLALDVLSPMIGSRAAAWIAGCATWPQWWVLPNIVTIAASLAAVRVTYKVMLRIVDRWHLNRIAAFGAAWFATICGGVVGGTIQWLVRTAFVVLGNILDLVIPDFDEILENPHYLIPYLGNLAEAEDIYHETQYPDFLLPLGIGTTWGVLAGLIMVAPAALLAALLATRRRDW